jgi:hypothetical protein
LQLKNQYALHSEAGCVPANRPTQMSGVIGQQNCNTSSGCTVGEQSARSYGEAFALNRGGVWVTELASSGVSIWFFERQDVPRSLTVEATSIDPSTLGLPSAFWPAEGCAPISRYLHTQQAVINIALVCLQPSIGLKRVVADPITLRRPAVRSELPLSLELTHSDRSDASSYTPPRSGLAIPTQCVQADARHPSLRRHVVSL